MIYQGTWNASTNFPVLTSSTGTKGYVYRVTTSGSTNIDGITDWKSGDFIVYNGSTWDKWDSTDAVTSVNGYTGVVTLVKADVGLSNVENTALSTWAGSTNITTVGTIGSGTWQGTAIADTYISSASTWNAKIAGSGTTNYLSKFTAAGTIGNSAVFETAGNVGIGTTTPGSSLVVNSPGDTSSTYIAQFKGGGIDRFNFTSDGVMYWGLSAIPASANGYLSWDINKATVGAGGTNKDLSFITGTSERMFISSSGNVGIGTSNPNVALDVNGEIAIRGGDNADDARMYFRASDNSNRFTIETDLDSDTQNDILGFRSFNTDNILILKGNGNVGIGNTNPTSKLHITGDINISTILNATTDTDKFLVSDSGVIKYRTGAELLSDVGAQGSINLTTTGTSGAATLIGNTLNIPQYSGGGGSGTVTSVGLSMPTAFTVSNSPITSTGTLTVIGAGTTSDYIRGDGTLATFPTALPTANVKHSVKYAVALTKGQAVYVSSADGTNMVVSKADNSSEATSSKTLGLVTATGGTNYQGEVITEGLLAGLDTSTATVGDAVWLGTNGNLIFWHYGLTTKPVAPAHLVFIGIVTRVNANNGEIFVKPQNGFEIDELHDVSVVGRANNTVLGYNSSTSLHEFKTVPTWLGYTPVGGSGTANYIPKFTASGTIGDSAVFESSGNVLIGSISNSGFTLDVNTTSGTSSSVRVKGGSTGSGYFGSFNGSNTTLYALGDTASLLGGASDTSATLYTNTGVDMNFYIGGGHRMKILSTGNVGIGNTDPNYKLDVTGEIAIRGGEGADDARMYFLAGDNSIRFRIETDIDVNPNIDILGFRSYSTDNILILKGNGNIGIGIIDPSATLEVNGDVKISTIANATTDTDRFLVSDSGVVKYRTGTEVLSDIGLSNVNNTSDLNKPISTATQTALNLITDVNWLGDYNNGYTYSVGDGVMFNGASFRMYNYIGAAGYPPSAYPGNWKQITDYVSPNDIGLGNVDNTSDLNKPISTATQTALNLKLDANSSIDALNDVTITSPIVNQILQWNGSQWINASGSVVNAGPGVVYFLTDTPAGFGTYEYMSKTPDGLAEIQETVVVNNNTVLIHEYMSDVAVNKTTIDAGIWEFNLFGYVDTLNANFVVDVYKRTTGGTETLLFSAETELISWTAVDLSSVTTVQQQFTCDATDKLVVKVSGKTTQTSNVTLKLVHSGTTHYSHIHTPLTVVHNDIAGLQGGATGEYYHLNSAANTKLLSWQSSGIPNADIQSASTWNSKIGGSGTANYISKFTASGTIGNSLIQDDGTGLSIGISSPYPGVKFYVASTGIAIVGSGTTYGVQGKGEQYGVWGESTSDEAGNHVGVYGSAGDIDGGGATYIGGRFVGGGSNGINYSLWLQDNTEGAGKFLKSITSDGKANWATMSVADTGLTLTTTGTSGAATLVGNTLNIPQYPASSIPTLKSDETYRGISINNNSTTVVVEGGVVMSTSASTLAQSVASTNFATKQIRLRYYASVVSGGRYSGTRGSALLWYIHGGFRFVCDFNISDTAFSAGCQQFYGMSGVTTDLSYGGAGGPLVGTLLNIVGVGSETGDTNLQVFHNDGAGLATKVDLGVNFPANRTAGAISTTVYGIQLYNAPMTTDVKYEVTNKETGAIATGTVSTNLPLTSQGLNFFASRAMANTSVTSTGQFDLMKLGVYSI